MAFEEIACVSPAKAGGKKSPPNGVAVTARKLGTRSGKQIHYIRIEIGAVLARGIALTQDNHRLRLLFGTGSDAGKVQVSVDNAAGKFAAKRTRSGSYVITINAATADGRFALTFDPFTDGPCEPIRPQNGQPPHFVFKASAGMLAVED